VKWDGRYVAGVSKISGLRRTTEVIHHREGGDPSTTRKSPGLTEFAPITLERGVTHDPEFENWANKVWSLSAGLGAEVSLKDFRKDIVLELYNEAGQVVLAYKIYRCWISEYQVLPRSGRHRECGRDRAHHPRERRLGTGSIGKGTGRAIFQEIVITSVGRSF
jgi:phage tail-like protein